MPETSRSQLYPFTRRVNFLNRSVRIPMKAEEYVTQHYTNTCMNEEVLTVENWKTAPNWSVDSLLRIRRPYSMESHRNLTQALLPEWAKKLHDFAGEQLLKNPHPIPRKQLQLVWVNKKKL
jgi:hypothetical protein